MTTRMPAYNSTYPKVAVQWLNEALCIYQNLCLVDSEVLRNRHLRVAAKRYAPPKLKKLIITKEITKDNELYLYMDGELIYKRWLNTGESKVFDVMAYDKYTYASYTDLDVKNSPELILIKAKMRLKTTEEGGRINGIKSGYRPNHVFEFNEKGELKEAFMGDIQFEGDNFLELGKEYEVIVRFLFVQRMERFMDIGRTWWINEGGRTVGEAKIIKFELPKNN